MMYGQGLDCPVCGKETYTRRMGYSDPEGPQLEPDEGDCETCGFRYTQHVNSAERQQAEEYTERLIQFAIETMDAAGLFRLHSVHGFYMEAKEANNEERE